MKPVLAGFLLSFLTIGAWEGDTWNILDRYSMVYPPMVGCTEGRDISFVDGAPGCRTAAPTLGACEIGPTVTGNDFEGRITAGGGVLTSCSLNFSKTLSAIPKCIVSTSFGAVSISALSTSGFTVSGLSLTGGLIYYKCWGAS